MFCAYDDGSSLLRAVVAAGGSNPPSALYSAFFMLIVLGFAKVVLVTKIDAAPSAGKGKGEGMSKNILGFVKLLFASLFDTVHGLGMSALAGVALP